VTAAAALLLVVSIGALATTGLRAATWIGSNGLERAVVAAVLAAAAASLEALGLGLFGLGGSALALAGAAVVSWGVVRALLPAPAPRVRSELREWCLEAGPLERAAVGGVGGLAVAVAAIVLHRPQPGVDGITDHIAVAVAFVQGGHTGSLVAINHVLPVASYPLSNEVLLSWLTGISRGFAALTLWTPVLVLLLIAAGWLGLRRLAVPAWLRALALAALICGPLLVVALPQPSTDIPALTWLVCAVVLCAAAAERPALLAVAIIALGLAIGTKTTAATLGVPVLGWSIWRCRASLRPVWPLLAAAVLGAVGVGGVWYLRNWGQHSSPLWPFSSAAGGDPIPLGIQVADHTMLERFRQTLLDHVGDYVSLLSGSLVLIVAGVLVPLAARRRRTLIASGAVLLGALVWANAPVTGYPDIPLLAFGVRSSVRYLLPVFAAGSLALALTASDRSVARPVRCAAIAGLVAALVWGLITDARNSFYLPLDSWLVPGLIVGCAGGYWAGPWLARRVRVTLMAPLVALLAVAALAGGASGFGTRHGLVSSEVDTSFEAYLNALPVYRDGSAPVAASPFTPAFLAGDRLRHKVTLIGSAESCASVRARAARGWVVVELTPHIPIPGHPGQELYPRGTAPGCLAAERPLLAAGLFRVYGPATTGP